MNSECMIKVPNSIAMAPEFVGSWYVWHMKIHLPLFALAVFVLVAASHGLVPALLAGLLAYNLMRSSVQGCDGWKRTIRIILVVSIMVFALGFVGMGVAHLLATERITDVLPRLAGILVNSRSQLPLSLAVHVPDQSEEMLRILQSWITGHAGQITSVSKDFGRALGQTLIGLVIGSLMGATRGRPKTLLAEQVCLHASRLALAFRQIVFAQARISALNTVLTGIFLVLILPRMGIDLPYTGLLILLTFLAGMIPILGNLISNTAITLMALSHSMAAAALALLFLILIHKLEYFINARIVGGRIQASSWELLLAMLFMEALMGIPGLVLAPVLYAWLRMEVRANGWL